MLSSGHFFKVILDRNMKVTPTPQDRLELSGVFGNK
jgi:hypothetical protein